MLLDSRFIGSSVRKLVYTVNFVNITYSIVSSWKINKAPILSRCFSVTLCFELHSWSEADLQWNYSQCVCVPETLIECNVKWDLVVIVILQPTNQACLCIRNSAIASWEIAHASAEDEGLYECVAQSSAGQGRALTQLTVRGMSRTCTHTAMQAHTHASSVSLPACITVTARLWNKFPAIFISDLWLKRQHDTKHTSTNIYIKE